MRSFATMTAMLLMAVPALAGPVREAELRHLVLHDCGACHGMTLKGGLGPPLRPEALAGKDRSTLVDIVLDGITSTPMPPWRPWLNKAEATWIVKTLQEGGF
ncbi:MAG: cytochrome c [Geminicoccaceae bacterium]